MFEGFDSLDWGKSWEVADIVAGQDLVSDVEVPLIHALLILAADEGLVFLC